MRRAIRIVPILVLSPATFADVVVFENDYNGFLEAVGVVNVIDFDTLPNGEPTEVSVELTEDFNYDEQGVHFSAPIPYPFCAGNPSSGFGLRVEGGTEESWIITELITPAQAVGGFFGGFTELCTFDELGDQIACVSYSEPGGPNFVGIVSDIPIHSATLGDGDESETISSFVFAPVPEPGTVILVASGLVFMARRRRRS